MKDFEKEASAKIQALENGWKSAEAGLKTYERQVVEIQGKDDRELDRSSGLRGEISTLREEVQKLQAEKQKADDSAQQYYDQGFNEAANSLKSQLAQEYNKYFLQGWTKAPDQAGVDDDSVLYSLGQRHQPFKLGSFEEHVG